MRKVFVVGSAKSYARWMESVVVDTMDEADFVVFTGGEDIHPKWYNEPVGYNTYSNEIRDIKEIEAYKQAKELNLPCVGICRGAQLLCVMNGGRLVQDQFNPGLYHDMITKDGKVLEISSSHHQAAYPFNLNPDEYDVIAYTTNASAYHNDGEGREMNPPKECEIVEYFIGRDLGIQGHPEMYALNHETVKYLQELLTNFLNKT